MLRLEARPQPSKAMSFASPLLALLITVLIGIVMFAWLGKDPLRALQMFFYEPIKSGYAWTEIAVKATPLVLIGLGLSICYRSNVWNIGAEGQYVIGAVFASGVAMQAGADTPRAIVLVILAAGIVGGMVWAGIVALLRDRFNANEILVSLMLVYVAVMVLSYLVYGPWKDPEGLQLPADHHVRRHHQGAAVDRRLPPQHRRADRAGGGGAGVVVPVSHLSRLRTAGGRPGTGGRALRRLLVAPRVVDRAADLGWAGGSGRRTRSHRAAGPADARTCRWVTASPPSSSPTSAGCIRLACVFAGILMSMFYIGGELAQSRLGLPKSLTGVFQGLLLFALLACDTLIHYRIRWRGVRTGAWDQDSGCRRAACQEAAQRDGATACAASRTTRMRFSPPRTPARRRRSPRLFERSERSERSEFLGAPRDRAPEGIRSEAEDAAYERRRIPARGFASLGHSKVRGVA